jgi:hypothetical protein
MAKTSIHIVPANLGKCGKGSNAEGHAYREKHYMDIVQKFPDAAGSFKLIAPQNKVQVWKNPAYSEGLLELLERDKREAAAHSKTGKAPVMKDRVRVNPKTGRAKTITSWSPIREGVAVTNPNTTLQDFAPLVQWFDEHGIGVISIALHSDEGHRDLETGEVKINWHGHLLLDYMNHATGKTVKLTKAEVSEMQTVLANSLGMERGTSNEETKRPWLESAVYRYQQQKKAFANLEAAGQEIAYREGWVAGLNAGIGMTTENENEKRAIFGLLLKEGIISDEEWETLDNGPKKGQGLEI